MKIELPFWDVFRNSMLTGRKFMTTRSKRYGKANDTFEAFGQEFIITNVFKVPIKIVASFFYEAEGFDCKECFIDTWKKIHPKVGYQPDKEYWVHLFGIKI